MERGRGLNGFELKLAMAALMLLDHLYYFLPGRNFPLWFTMAGRLVAPTFCFLMTESLRHTKSRGRYLRRMTAAGLVMLMGNALMMLSAASLRGGHVVVIQNNIFLSLAVSAALVDRLERLRQQGFDGKQAGLVVLLLLIAPQLEGGLLIPAMAMIFYFLRDHRARMAAAYLIGGSLMVYLLAGRSGSSARYAFELLGLRLSTQYLQAFALIPIGWYNGRPGPRNTFARWFFYLFYPLHIWALYLIGVLG